MLRRARASPTTCSTPRTTRRKPRSWPRPASSGAVTVATNMAGRGTDIMLGGNAEYLAKSDLRQGRLLSDDLIAEATGFAETDDEDILDARKMFAEAEAKYQGVASRPRPTRSVRRAACSFMGTERHESRRIDNQLRGRAGRQGDPGETRFFLSLEDDIMRLFGSERVMGMMEKLGVDEDTPIDAKILSGAIENAQKSVESRNFQTRKNVLQYDDVMNTQREVIYKQRRQVLDGEDLQASIQTMLHSMVENAIHGHMGEQKHMDAEAFREAVAPFRAMFLKPGELELTDEELQQYDAEGLVDLVSGKAHEVYAQKEQEIGAPLMRELERVLMLRVVDEYWMDQIDAMNELKQGIGLRAYAQTDPVVAYKKEGYEMFENMVAAIQEETLRRLFLVRLRKNEEVKRERVAKVTSESGGGEDVIRKAAREAGHQDRPQRPLPLRQRPEVEKVHLRPVSPPGHPGIKRNT